uniref:Putative ATP synthase F0 subunit I n=1 Tax=uncultured bacterium CBNPD1 BAC clone 2089 TaxID=417311 RepID=B1N6P5_9BACT|nr:putative ATP synthase F0 subunit I [uncultured bacterium CBNPD1 BAC clone 2089]
MRLLPDPERIRSAARNSKSPSAAGDQGLGQGAEIAIGLLVFFGIGAGIDWWAGTTPVFMIAFTIFCAIGQFVRVWYGYDARMRNLEADRAHNARAHQTSVAAGDSSRAERP